jgi:hypothetical protein
MPKVRLILRPPKEGKNVTLAEARAAFRELNRERQSHPGKKREERPQKTAKAG